MSSDERQLIGISKIARQKVIDRLKFSYANDYLDETEFEQRLNLATNTKSKDILHELVVDLPQSDEPETVRSPAAESLHINKGQVKEHDTLVSFFSGITRKGEWRPARKLRVVAVMGGVELDFTNALLPPGVIEIDVFCLMGGLEIRVPEGINVDAQCLAIMGGVDNHGLGEVKKDSPTIRVRGFVLMGGVDVKPPKKKYFRKFLKKMFTDE